MDAEVLLPLAPRQRLPLHRAAATAALSWPTASARRDSGSDTRWELQASMPVTHRMGPWQPRCRTSEHSTLVKGPMHSACRTRFPCAT